MTYDHEFANAGRRFPLSGTELGRCLHCGKKGIVTGSQFEWPCLILKDWICETHCAEVQLRDYGHTRDAIGTPDRLGSRGRPAP